MSSLLSAELSATCSALGAVDVSTDKYLIDEFTLNTVKDLIRYLRRDGEDHEIRIQLGQSKVLQNDLIPMLVHHWENVELLDVTLRLLVNLTNPALLLFREEVPTERTARHKYLQILSHLQSYKEEAFTKIDVWNIFYKKLFQVLEIDWNERDEDTGLIIERILILIRNVLHVPANLDHEKRPENDASVHDQVLWALSQSQILDVLLYMSSQNEKQYYMHILEIITHLLREQNPTCLANSALQRSVDEKIRDEQELISMRRTESLQRNNKVKQYSSTRHSRFGGMYVVQNMEPVTDNKMISLKPLSKLSNLNFGSDNMKSKFVKPKNRRPEESLFMERRSTFAVRLSLKEFCIDFLNGSYNPLMNYVKDVLVRAKAQQNDESYYLWAIKFFMEFNRGFNFQVGLVSETISVSMFHYVQQQMEKYYDMIKIEKKKFPLWVRRQHLALRAYKELINTLLAMEKDNDEGVRESAKVLKSNIFYVLEYREFILTTFMSYDENKMPRSYLVDLVETVHLFLKMLEHFCKKTGLVVQKKLRKKNKSKKRKSVNPRPTKAVELETPPWEEVRAQLAAVLTSGLDSYPPPFDAASDVPIDEQKETCMKNIQKLMKECQYEDAIGTFRSAREVWPEEGIFGVSDMPGEEELSMLQSIYNADLGVETSRLQENENDENHNSERDDDDEDEEREEEIKSSTIVETDFDFMDFVRRFCQPRVVSACVFLLERYDKNLPYTNHCIIKILHRIAWDCKQPSMMFQATLFITFQKILNNPSPLYQELTKFALFIFKKFTKVASSNPKVFIELLFWKTTKNTYEIENGYDVYDESKLPKGVWTEEQEEELRKLYMENQENPATDKDVIDWMLENLIDHTRTRRSVIKKLKDMGLIFNAPTKKSNKVREKVSKEFTEEEDNLLREFWNAYAEDTDPMGEIISRMPRKRSKPSFIERLLYLGIIDDRKQCRKKRSKKSGNKSKGSGDDDSSNDNESESDKSDSDSNDDIAQSPKQTKKTKVNLKGKAKRPTNRNNSTKATVYSASETAKLLIEAVDNGLSDPLKWLAEMLEEVALDQEAEGFDPDGEGVPIVPIMSECAEAMENKLFQKVLQGVGMKPPFDEQESYWRIPSTLHFETLRTRREIIDKAVDRTLVIETTAVDTHISDAPDVNDAESSDDDAVFDNLRKMRENVIPIVNKNKSGQVNRKRSRSIESIGSNKKSKIQKIVEEEEERSDNDNNGDDDILSFARKTLQQDTEPDTEDILSFVRQRTNGSISDKENENDEENENVDNGNDNDDDDILSFARKTLQQDKEPDTEDILSFVRQQTNGSISDKENDSDEDIPVKRDHKKRKFVIEDDDSD